MKDSVKLQLSLVENVQGWVGGLKVQWVEVEIDLGLETETADRKGFSKLEILRSLNRCHQQVW